ncbi:MAG TPA: ABC transporter permease [Bellilinea sp.]|nr:ABC transporter permease [Bellilinea sp.]
MLRYISRRLIASLFTLVIISVVIFLMLRLLPGDPARLFAGDMATGAEVEHVRVQLGLDKPITEQYVVFVKDLFKGDLGTSMRTQEPVLEDICARFPATMKLAFIAILLACVIGIPAGILAALKPYSIFDTLASVGTLVGVAMPVYWFGLMMIVLFAVKLRWLPAAGNTDGIKSVILPAVTLAFFSMALITRMTRASMLEVLTQEYVITAREKGLKESTVIFRHVFRNAMIPVITVVGLQFGGMLGGSILTETIFAWPGLGRLLTESLAARDYPMVQGLVLIFASLVILVNLGVDILYSFIDPRIRYE